MVSEVGPDGIQTINLLDGGPLYHLLRLDNTLYTATTLGNSGDDDRFASN